MPASEVQKLYREHKLHSGPGGPIVKSKKQATAIQISMARKEGHDIPEVKGSFQQGGLVPESGAYQVHQGEQVTPPGFYAGATAPRSFYAGAQEHPNVPAGEAPDLGIPPPGMPPALGPAAGGPPPPQGKPDEPGRKNPWLAEMRANVNAPLHTIQGFQHGGLVPETGIYQLHEGEQVVPKNQVRTGGFPSLDTSPSRPSPHMQLVPDLDRHTAREPRNASRIVVEGIDEPKLRSFQKGGTVDEEGPAKLHFGEQVLPPPGPRPYSYESIVPKAAEADWKMGRYGLMPPNAVEGTGMNTQAPGYLQYEPANASPGSLEATEGVYHPYLMRRPPYSTRQPQLLPYLRNQR